jgi:hypothetical protein
MYQVYQDGKDLGKLEYALHQLIDQLLLGHPGAAGALSLPVIADLYRQGLVTAGLHTHIRELDQYLFYAATLMLNEQNMGFARGALGFVHYFVERLPDAQLEKYLRSMLPDLLNTINTPLAAASNLSATIDLKLTSGITGLLLVLIKGYRNGLHDDEIKKTVRAQILKIISYREDLDFSRKRYSIFPESVEKHSGDALFSNALTWNSGDLNQSLLFYRSNALFGDLELKRMGDLVGLNTLLRKDQGSTSIADAAFFSGSSGLAQTYHYLLEATQNKAYREGYDFWISKTVEFLAQEVPAGVYDNRELDILNGLTGIGLTLLTYRHNVKWSHCVLL